MYKELLMEALGINNNAKKIVDIDPWDDHRYIRFFKDKIPPNSRSGRYFQDTNEDRILVQDIFNDIMCPSEHPYFMLYKGVVGYLKLIRTTEYFKMCAEARGHGTAADEYASISDETVEKYANDMLNGDKFPIPVVNFAKGGQEGRHRVAAAAKNGATMVPCVIIRELEKDELPKILGFEEGWTIRTDASDTVIGTPNRKMFRRVPTVRDMKMVVEAYRQLYEEYRSK